MTSESETFVSLKGLYAKFQVTLHVKFPMLDSQRYPYTIIWSTICFLIYTRLENAFNGTVNNRALLISFNLKVYSIEFSRWRLEWSSSAGED